jgi:hypothetical protein
MRRNESDRTIPLAISALVPLAIGASLVGFRSDLRPDVTVLVLALTVVFGAVVGGPVGGTTAAVSAAATFDFFYTVPYRSLKINDWRDVLTTFLLLVVGLAVGGLRAYADRRTGDAQVGRLVGGGLSRVVGVAATSVVDDVESAVRAELLGVLRLDECWFSEDPRTDLPVLPRDGHLDNAVLVERQDGYALPLRGFRIPVQAAGRTVGYLVCLPSPGSGVSLERRRLAVAMADVLGLARSAREQEVAGREAQPRSVPATGVSDEEH